MIGCIKFVFFVTVGIYLAVEASADTQCGEILIGSLDNVGAIDYKFNSTYDNDERCVWTIRFLDGNQMQFTLYAGDVNYDLNDGVSISTFSRTEGSTNALIDQRILVINDTQTVTLNGNVAVVTFFTNAESTFNGFRLEYVELGEPSPYISLNSIDFISNLTSSDESMMVKHPAAEGNYDNQELSTFVMTYPDFRLQAEKRLSVGIRVDLDQTCDCCDVVFFYKFSPIDGMTTLYDVCRGGFISMYQSDIMLLVFKSDDQGFRTGFNISLTVNNA